MKDSHQKGLSYRDAGVDIEAASKARKRIASLVRSTFTEGVLTDVGGFGGLFRIPGGYKEPVLVSSTDGVGTKLKVAFLAGKHHTVGLDLVNHCINDVLCSGARPLFFLDYIATGKLEAHVITEIVRGLSKACKQAGCALIGGETAEMPDFYSPGEYDLAGTIVGLAEQKHILTPSSVAPGDLLIGLQSNGLHTNGYSLARKVFFEIMNLGIGDFVSELNCTVGEELLKPHRCYAPALQGLLSERVIKSIAHITGGGITDNLPRALPEGLGARINVDSWPEQPVFRLIRKAGNVEDEEMRRVFNMGIGFVIIVGPDNCGAVRNHIGRHGIKSFEIGTVIEGNTGVSYV